MEETAKPWNSDSYPMKNGKQRRNLEYSYHPPGGVDRSTRKRSYDDTTSSHSSKGDIASHSPKPCGQHDGEKKTNQVVRRRKKRRGKKSIQLTRRDVQRETQAGTLFEDAEQLLEYWREQYEKRFGVQYEIERKSKQLELCDSIVEAVKDLAHAKRFVLALLTSPQLEWVEQKTLSFLAKPGNRSRIAPAIHRRKRTHKAEYLGDRSKTLQITFRA